LSFETAISAIEAAHASEKGVLREALDAAQTLADQAFAMSTDANTRADRAEAAVATERQRADDLRTQIDVLSTEMGMVRREAEQALAEERQRADRLGERVDAVQAEADRAAIRADRAEAVIGAERQRADTAVALAAEATRISEELRAELDRRRVGHEGAERALAEVRAGEAARKDRGVLARLRAAWRRE